MPNVSGERFRVIWPAIARVAILAVLCAGAGWLFGVRVGLWLAVACLAALYLGQLFYLASLGNWLERPSLNTIPNGIGAWGEVFARLYRQHRASEMFMSLEQGRSLAKIAAQPRA